MKPRDVVLPSSLHSESARDDYDTQFKLRLMGDAGVGKSALLHRIVEGTDPPDFSYGGGLDVKSKIIDVHANKVKLNIWNAGRGGFSKESSQSARFSQLDIFVFDVTDTVSFNNLDKYIKNESPDTGCEKKAPIIIVANKFDMHNKRAVTDEAINDYVDKLIKDTGKDVILVGVSAKTGLNVDILLKKIGVALDENHTLGPHFAPNESTFMIESKKESSQIAKNAKASTDKRNNQSKIVSDWGRAEGNNAVDKAISVLDSLTCGGSKAMRILSGHPWRQGVYEVDAIVKKHINEVAVPSLDDLIAKLERIPNVPKGSYLSDFVRFLKENKSTLEVGTSSSLNPK